MDALYCVVDLHAMTLPWDPDRLREETLGKAAELLACGIDPERSVLFVQSHVPAHSELTWVLTCLSRMGELRRMIQFKERARGETESVGTGLFAYPVLMAADILLYQTELVPVGEDQRQHVELTRDLAGRFNSTFGETFTMPEAWVAEAGARIMSLDDPTQKMSKSDDRPGAAVFLVDPPEVIQKKIRAAVTDSGREVEARPNKPALTNLLTIFSLVTGEPVAALEARFAGSGYGRFKQELADAVVDRLAPIRDRYLELLADRAELARLLAVGAQDASRRAAATMESVRARTGLVAAGTKTSPAGSAPVG